MSIGWCEGRRCSDGEGSRINEDFNATPPQCVHHGTGRVLGHGSDDPHEPLHPTATKGRKGSGDRRPCGSAKAQT